MATSMSELKSRLLKFLADPKAEGEFRYWFASLLAGPMDDLDTQALAHAIDSAFADAAEGLCTGSQLRAYLDELTKEQQPASASSLTTAKFVEPGTPSTSNLVQIFATRRGELVSV